MNKRKSALVGLSVLSSLSLALAACGGENNSDNGPEKPSTAAAASNAAGADAAGKYDPPITVHSIRPVDSTVTYDSGEDISNNRWSEYFKDALGIDMVYDWTTAKNDDYVNKLNVIIASGDKPADIYQVNASQLQQLADAGVLADLTEAFDKYASPLTKKLMNGDGGKGMSSATFGGKLLALPQGSATITNNDVLWIRTDWLKNVGLSEPKSIDDLVKIADAFVNQDPDKNGKKDTLGLGITQGPSPSNGGVADLGGWFAGFKAYPDRWVKDAAGQAVFGSIQPEVKQALAKLQEMYKSGLIDKEWAVKDSDKFGEDVLTNKVGIWYGANWNSMYPIDISKNKDLLNVKPFSIVAVDGKQPVMQAVDPSVNTYFVVSKDFKHPEAVVKLMTAFQEKLWGESSEFEKYGTNANQSVSYFKYPLVQSWPATKDIPDNLDAIRAALSSNDASKLNSEQKGIYTSIKAFNDGDIVTGYSTARQYDAFEVIKKDDLNNQLFSLFYGAPTPTMVEKKQALDKLEQEVFTKIIMGAEPVDEFDKFVSDWKKLGGDQITQEVNDWVASHK
ncbi:putative aldouronate transport system substrate-binding protein [Cohnella sp. OV330]|uniref:extracellular solute-binding protein n=1 Tax=Cohnella sp. OV330 TaxID=1855288 RepID=UPI0008E2E015|nr:extracellular solute-binding protein [Cohnella sp. OV330]SFA79766.1 putative aldouronate transport system substrate-binding protein [Cohnella sp. OV330]